MIYTKKEEIKWKSSKLRSFLFPSYLLVIDSRYDITYQNGNVIEDPSVNFQKFKNEFLNPIISIRLKYIELFSIFFRTII